MCCFRLHFTDLNVLFQKNKNLLQFTFEKKQLVVQKERKNKLSWGKIPAPLDIKSSTPHNGYVPKQDKIGLVRCLLYGAWMIYSSYALFDD